MKRIFTLLFSVIVLSLTTSAQIAKGSTLLGGQLSYSHSNIDYLPIQEAQKNNDATFDISVGRAFSENSIFGLNVGSSSSLRTNIYNGATYVRTRNSYYNVGVFFRQYKSLARDFYFFADLGAGYIGWSQSDKDADGVEVRRVRSSGGQVSLTPGISYKLFKKFHLELLIPNIIAAQYSVSRSPIPQANDLKQKDFSFFSNLKSTGLNSLGVGFRFIL